MQLDFLTSNSAEGAPRTTSTSAAMDRSRELGRACLASALVLSLAACGAGGGDAPPFEDPFDPGAGTGPDPTGEPGDPQNDPPVDPDPEGPDPEDLAPFGLDGLPPAPALNFDFSAGSVGPYELPAAYPSLGLASVDLAPIPDGSGRLVSVDKNGFALAFPDDPSSGFATTFLDLASKVSVGGEAGLLGLTFAPDFSATGELFVVYTTDFPSRTVLSRLQVQGDSAPAWTEQELLTIPRQTDFHNGGGLRFGNDGYLYLALGDDLEAGFAQDLSNLRGKILRLDRNGQPAPGNPFASLPGARAEIYAYGFRNPWRLSVDPWTGDVWVADVGAETREEINQLQPGGNFGWPAFEGSVPNDSTQNLNYADSVPPTYEYDHGVGRCVIGGFVYRGSQLPELNGSYLFADATTGDFWALAPGAVSAERLGAGLPFPVIVAPDGAGEPLIGCLSGGQVRRLAGQPGESQPNDPPFFLSQTGLFSDLFALTPSEGMLEYEVNSPLWSDGAYKRRFFGLPAGGRVQFSTTDAWGFPQGTALVKHFSLAQPGAPPKKIETRVFLNTASGWRGFTYRWNVEGTDAYRISEDQVAVHATVDPYTGQWIEVEWQYPGPSSCNQCHTPAAGYVLGLRTGQLNREFDFALATDNQLRTYEHIGLFESATLPTGQFDPAILSAWARPDDFGAPLNDRARSYLAANCASCHLIDGATGLNMDLAHDTPIWAMNTHGVFPTSGDLGLWNPARIRPWAANSSVLFERMRRLDGTRMPPLGSTHVDLGGVALIEAWINSGAGQ